MFIVLSILEPRQGSRGVLDLAMSFGVPSAIRNVPNSCADSAITPLLYTTYWSDLSVLVRIGKVSIQNYAKYLNRKIDTVAGSIGLV